MAANVFVSYDHVDRDRVHGFLSLIYNPNHFLSFHDWSLKQPVVDRVNNPLPYRPSDSRSIKVQQEIIQLFSKASRMVVLVGTETYKSEWVNWEIETFFKLKQPYSRYPHDRIRALRFKGIVDSRLPSKLTNRSGNPINWNLNELDQWLDGNIN